MTTVAQLLQIIDYEDLYKFDKENPNLSKIIEEVAFRYELAWEDVYLSIRDFLRNYNLREEKS